jgi:Fe-S cluster biogenesis protein NfuA/nitrite reductase/ring-hydroxylating ferredoxin subunit
MAEGERFQHAGEHIERLLAEIRTSASPPAWQRVEELMRVVVELYGAGLRHIVRIVDGAGAAADGIVTRMTEDELVASLLLVHDIHPDNLATRVQKALARVRPYLGSHGGDVEVLAVDEAASVVRLRMTGSCDGCPSSLLTVKLAVEGAIRELAPEIARVEVDGVTGNGHATAATTPAGGEPPAASWVTLETSLDVAPRSVTAREVQGGRIMLCRLGDDLYAYHDACAACGGALAGGRLEGQLLACPACGRRYDMRRAGRGVESPDVQLVPVPLLEDATGVRIALREVHA